MNAPVLRRATLVLSALIVAAAVTPSADAGKVFGRRRGCCKRSAQQQCCPPVQCCPTRSGCICVRSLFADLGQTQVYYAHEYDECFEENCPYPFETYHTGQNLQPHECPNCPGTLRSTTNGQPTLDAPRPEATFDLWTPGDADVSINPALTVTRLFEKTGIMERMEDGRRIPVKVFFAHVEYAPNKFAVVSFGVEVDRVTTVQFDKRARRRPGFTHLHDLSLSGPLTIVITNQ